MNYCDLMESTAKKRKSLVCLGLDPVLERIPVAETDLRKKLVIFFESILNEIVKRNTYPSAVKPNYAFYAQYGFDGLFALKEIIDLFKKESIPVILDAKRGDIGATSEAYAKEAFDFFCADSVTLAPYMGYDSIKPFAAKYPDRGLYVLCRTSNKSAVDFQDLNFEGKPLYIKVAEKICEWGNPGLGAVTGATYPAELESIVDLFHANKKRIPLLIPGIGTQGGDIKATVSAIKKHGDLFIHRINSSSGILYAHEKAGGEKFYAAAVNELEKLNIEINENAGI